MGLGGYSCGAPNLRTFLRDNFPIRIQVVSVSQCVVGIYGLRLIIQLFHRVVLVNYVDDVVVLVLRHSQAFAFARRIVFPLEGGAWRK